MNKQPTWHKTKDIFQSNFTFLKKYLPKHLHPRLEEEITSEVFNLTVEFKIKGIVNNDDNSIDIDEKYVYYERGSKFFFKKKLDDLSSVEKEHLVRIIHNIMAFLYSIYSFEFFFLEHLLFDNFEQKNKEKKLEKVNYQISKVEELIKLKKIITQSENTNLELLVNKNLKGKENKLHFNLLDQNLVSLDQIVDIFTNQYNSWEKKSTRLLLNTSDSQNILTFADIDEDMDVVLGGNYDFTGFALLFAFRRYRFTPEPTLESLETVLKLLNSFKGKDNRKNKYYSYLNMLVLTVKNYILDEWINLCPNHKLVEAQLGKLIANFILLFEFIPEQNKLIDTLENGTCRDFVRGFTRKEVTNSVK